MDDKCLKQYHTYHADRYTGKDTYIGMIGFANAHTDTDIGLKTYTDTDTNADIIYRYHYRYRLNISAQYQ